MPCQPSAVRHQAKRIGIWLAYCPSGHQPGLYVSKLYITSTLREPEASRPRRAGKRSGPYREGPSVPEAGGFVGSRTSALSAELLVGSRESDQGTGRKADTPEAGNCAGAPTATYPSGPCAGRVNAWLLRYRALKLLARSSLAAGTAVANIHVILRLCGLGYYLQTVGHLN